MPRNGALIVSDLFGKLTMLRIECDKCGRKGRCRLSSLRPDKLLTDFLFELTNDCPRRKADSFANQCGARFPDLPKVL
jgi:hypothetical protein